MGVNMMRALLSVTTLLLVVFLVMKLSASQMRTLAPAGPGASAATSAAASAVNRSGTSTNAAQQAAQRVQQAIDQGAAQRAEDAASR